MEIDWPALFCIGLAYFIGKANGRREGRNEQK